MPAITSALSAICGTHLGDTNAVASTTGRPASASALDQFDLDRGRNALRLVLQSVARPDFDHLTFFGRFISHSKAFANDAKDARNYNRIVDVHLRLHCSSLWRRCGWRLRLF